MQDLKILCLQTDIYWDDPARNRDVLGIKILNHAEGHHLVVLPETFTTGFPDFPNFSSEELDGATLRWMETMASKTGAVITGSLLIDNEEGFTNTLIWMRPDGSYEQYAKRHVFSMAREHEVISPGKKKVVIELNGWKVMPMICYDLRFPVWSKNRLLPDGSYEYDLLLYIANWPGIRSYPWRQLLIARAIENLSYTVGLNRVGRDPNGIYYSGDSMIIDPKGKVIEQGEEAKERALTADLSHDHLMSFREKFNVGPDWDDFELKGL
jgi:predicted amidohydrolase